MIRKKFKILTLLVLAFFCFSSFALATGSGSSIFDINIHGARGIDLSGVKVSESNILSPLLIMGEPLLDKIKKEREYQNNLLETLRDKGKPKTHPLDEYKKKYDEKLLNLEEKKEARDMFREDNEEFLARIKKNSDFNDEYGSVELGRTNIDVIFFSDKKIGFNESYSDDIKRSFTISQLAKEGEEKENAKSNSDSPDKKSNAQQADGDDAQDVEEEVEFDPEEDAEFTKIETLKTWVAEKYQKKLQLIQDRVLLLVPQHPRSGRYTEKAGSFGRTSKTISSIELPFLQFVKEVSQNKNPITLEIAAGSGFVTWKVPLAFAEEGRHYVNELNDGMMKKINGNIHKTYRGLALGGELKRSIKAMIFDCFKILEKCPYLENKVDAIYVQNFEHFLTPKEHQKFLKLIGRLLAPGGRAFLCAKSFRFGNKKGGYKKLYQFHMQQKRAEKMYWGYVQYDHYYKVKRLVDVTTKLSINERVANGLVKLSNIRYPQQGILTKTLKAIDTKRADSYQKQNNLYVLMQATAHDLIARNYFSPEIYKSALSKYKSLEVKDDFYIESSGKRRKGWHGYVGYAAVIVEKKKED